MTRVAIVTGGAGGLGVALARRLVQDGVSVAVADVDGATANAVARSLAGAIGLSVDVTSPQSAAEMVDAVIGRFGQLDALVNNAGIQGLAVPVTELPVDEWRRVVDVNLTGVFVVTRACLPHMLERGSGRIVNVASIAGKEGNPRLAAYSAAKGAVIAFTKAVAKEVATTGVLINCVAPGIIDAGLAVKATPAERELYTSKVPMGRMGRPEEFAELVAWLASPACSFSTGATFDLSGGRAVY